MLLALTRVGFGQENNGCQSRSTGTGFCQIMRQCSKEWDTVLWYTYSMYKYCFYALILSISLSPFILNSAVIVTHLCTASTFFTLLSWLPTFFKDTFPDAKVTRLPLITYLTPRKWEQLKFT